MADKTALRSDLSTKRVPEGSAGSAVFFYQTAFPERDTLNFGAGQSPGQTERINGKKVRRIRIVWNGIGEFTPPIAAAKEKTA